MYQNHQPVPQTVTNKRGANHGLHLVLSILTCGIWAITGWPIAAMIGRKHTTTVLPHTSLPQQHDQPPYGYPQQQPPPNQPHQHTAWHQPPGQ